MDHMRWDEICEAYAGILEQELVPAMGCTEPIAIAYCAAKAREVLGTLPEEIHVDASGNVIKNVKSVIVPNTGGRKGIKTAAAIGALAGDAGAELEVISHVPEDLAAELGPYLERTAITVSCAESEYLLNICVSVRGNGHSALVQAVNEHTNIVRIEKDGAALFSKEAGPVCENPDLALLSVENIVRYADTCDLDRVRPVLMRQIEYNTAISEEGLRGDYGANIGSVLLACRGNDIKNRAKAMAAAGSDARMNGCELPVVINSGSGNQGITASVPVITYAKELGADEDRLLRALLVSNLVTLHEKSGIGRLSAYCGAVSAGAGAGAGIAYLLGGGLSEISHTIVNALAITSGIVCDGAKASCAAKIAAAVDAGLLGYEMYSNGQQFYGGDGLVLKGVENTIRSFGRLGREGMRETDKEIIRMMTEN